MQDWQAENAVVGISLVDVFNSLTCTLAFVYGLFLKSNLNISFNLSIVLFLINIPLLAFIVLFVLKRKQPTIDRCLNLETNQSTPSPILTNESENLQMHTNTHQDDHNDLRSKHYELSLDRKLQLLQFILTAFLIGLAFSINQTFEENRMINFFEMQTYLKMELPYYFSNLPLTVASLIAWLIVRKFVFMQFKFDCQSFVSMLVTCVCVFIYFDPTPKNFTTWTVISFLAAILKLMVPSILWTNQHLQGKPYKPIHIFVFAAYGIFFSHLFSCFFFLFEQSETLLKITRFIILVFGIVQLVMTVCIRFLYMKQ